MEKANVKGRTIKFRSVKNNCIMVVHSRAAKQYAEYLEWSKDVLSYETLVNWDESMYTHINPIYIRKDYLATKWITDFIVTYKDGTKGVRELVDNANFYKLATIERFELSRRYWKTIGITNWKIVMFEEEE
ncbi:hypothetical protein [Hungatella hathewayi]|uniref:hypothetical protein n=1 Tax=Hungatella hathewayi TaxID=154046 RepID=UPI003566DED1